MSYKQVRLGQLIAPFGPGSIYTDRRGIPHVIGGLDFWFYRWDQTSGLKPCDHPEEFYRFEPRLSSLLRVNRFCAPPDFRSAGSGETPPPNAFLYTPALRFPRWYRNTKTGEMRKFNLTTQRIDPIAGGGRWMPVRFIAVCQAGHLCEFPWKQWIGCSCPGDGSLILTDRGGSELASIRIECRTCPVNSSGRKGKSLSGTTIRPDEDCGEKSAFQDAGISCPGDRPWLGEGAEQASCIRPLVGALINQTNIYFPRTVSAILLPDLAERDPAISEIRNKLQEDAGTCAMAKTAWRMNNLDGAVAYAQVSLQKRNLFYDSEDVGKALVDLFTGAKIASQCDVSATEPESEFVAFRRQEFNILRTQINDPKRSPNLRVISTQVPEDLAPWVARVGLVERLRETRVFYGFDRLQPEPRPLDGMPETAMMQMFRTPPAEPQDRWLPAIEVFGEGIYLELKEERIREWQDEHSGWLEERLDPAFPMAGILIYTAAGDSEGTLGGLVQLGGRDRLGNVVRRALSRASWCSADPVCSEHLGGKGSRLANLAACHACILLPETSCETINQGLDRAMLVGTPDERQRGWMAPLLQEIYTAV